MIVIETEKDSCGMWCFCISAGEDSKNLDVYALSENNYDTSEDAEMAALQWAVDSWHVM